MARATKKPPSNCVGARLKAGLFARQSVWDRATEECKQRYTCGNNCDAWFTDTLLRESCYAHCNSITEPHLATKEQVIKDVIGCEAYFVKTGLIPPCKDFNVEEDTAQGQAFVAETKAAEAFNNAQAQQQQTSKELQTKMMMIGAVAIIGLLIFLFIPSKNA